MFHCYVDTWTTLCSRMAANIGCLTPEQMWNTVDKTYMQGFVEAIEQDAVACDMERKYTFPSPLGRYRLVQLQAATQQATADGTNSGTSAVPPPPGPAHKSRGKFDPGKTNKNHFGEHGRRPTFQTQIDGTALPGVSLPAFHPPATAGTSTQRGQDSPSFWSSESSIV